MDKKRVIRVYKAYEKAGGYTDWAQCGGWRELAPRIFLDQVSDRSWQPFSLDNTLDSSETNNQDQLLIVSTGPVFKLQKVQSMIAIGQQLSQPENI